MQGLQMIEVAPDQILPSPFNHRQKFTGIDELCASLLEKGMISPITVRPNPVAEDEERYELVVGERRWRAAKKGKLAAITTSDVARAWARAFGWTESDDGWLCPLHGAKS